MSLSTIGSLIFGFVALVLAFVLEGGVPSALLSPTAAMIVFGGTIAAIGTSFPAEDLKRIPKILKVVFNKPKYDIPGLIAYFKEVAVKTRKEGLLSIEGDISSNNDLDPFIKKGLQMVVDGTEPSTVRAILEAEAMTTYERHKAGAAIFDAAGGYSPTMGIIGTVMGLVHVLGDLEDTDSLGGKIATAFIATLYGVGFANLVWLPIGTKLKAYNKVEHQKNELIIEAILSIQEGLNPNTLEEKLKSYMDKADLGKIKATEEV